ncbi:MAG: peptidoglycan-binding domain-containing protein, partial [Bryobacteraceae bacterium]
PLPAAAPPKKPAAGQRGAAPAKKQTARKRAANARKGRSTARTRAQQQPEPERIREIQQALAARGYAVQPTGAWDAATVEALRKFQEDHNINNLSGRGKLDPLTLIALGLGPSYSRPAPSSAAAGQSSTEGKQP